MTNLQRARNRERLKVRKSGDYIIRGIDGEDFFVNPDYVDDLINWINQQVDIAVTRAINETKEPELWRDLGPDDIIQEGDRILIDGSWELALGFKSRPVSCLNSKIAQRRVRKQDL